MFLTTCWSISENGFWTGNHRFKLRVFIVLFLSCSLFDNVLGNPYPISFELKNTFANENKISEQDSKQIIQILRKLVIAVEEKNVSKIVKYISKEKGAYLDVKGLWDYESILEEIKKEDSYLEVYFFDHETGERESLVKLSEFISAKHLKTKNG